MANTLPRKTYPALRGSPDSIGISRQYRDPRRAGLAERNRHRDMFYGTLSNIKYGVINYEIKKPL